MPSVLMGALYGVRSWWMDVHTYPDQNRIAIPYLLGSFGTRWYSARQRARCKRRPKGPHSSRPDVVSVPHTDPHFNCDMSAFVPSRCGINAYSLNFLRRDIDSSKSGDTKNRYYGRLSGYLRPQVSQYQRPPFVGMSGSSIQVLGICELWGKIARHPNGYRAQNARCVTLFIPQDSEHFGTILYETAPGWRNTEIVSVSPGLQEMSERLRGFEDQLVQIDPSEACL